MLYTNTLEAIGAFVEQVSGTDLIINELENEFLVAFMVKDEQRIETIGLAILEEWEAKLAAPRKKSGWLRKHDKQEDETSRQMQLRAVGSFLDEWTAASAVVQERDDGYSVEYTGLLSRPGEAIELTRLYEELFGEVLAHKAAASKLAESDHQ